ncbi:unnamed protein product [Timema podura]|uniref:Uncharacterized protein n=1 Tax=Timema podura TaxID=61482 RepID=A0ABN7P3H9_TIMPD|nr:unnamed protein product [Timema podura]
MSWIPECSPKVLLLAAGALFIGFLLLVVSLKLFVHLTKGVCRSIANMDGKTVIVTGANSGESPLPFNMSCRWLNKEVTGGYADMGVILFLSGLLMTSEFKPQPGIGKETARGLAQRGARVILACRNVEAADKVKDEIISSTGNSSVVVKKLDLSSLESVRQFANDVNRSEKRLDVLVHNAGYANTFSKQVTGDGLEITMATNHYGPFLLTHLLIVTAALFDFRTYSRNNYTGSHEEAYVGSSPVPGGTHPVLKNPVRTLVQTSSRGIAP